MKRLLWIMAGSMLAWAQAPTSVPTAVPAGSRQPSNLEFTVYLLTGAAQGDAADDVPQDLTSTVKQLRSIFNYKSYRLTESFMLRGRTGVGASASGVLPLGTGLNYEFRYSRVNVLSSERPPLFRIDGLRIRLTKPPRRLGGETIIDPVASIETDLDIREGQKTVVGKSSVNNSGDALILVIVPKLVE